MILDDASTTKMQLLYPVAEEKLRRAITLHTAQYSVQMKAVETIRSIPRQAELYAQGRTMPGKIVTDAKPGQSYHHYGLALCACYAGADAYLTKPRPSVAALQWAAYGAAVTDQGLVWGGSWPIRDLGHAELRIPGMNYTAMQKLLEARGMAALWAEFDRILKRPVGLGYGPADFSQPGGFAAAE